MTLKRYRLKIYDGQYEVLHKTVFEVDVDLDSTGRGSVLDRQLIALTERAKIAREPMDRPMLVVCDPVTGKPVLDWT